MHHLPSDLTSITSSSFVILIIAAMGLLCPPFLYSYLIVVPQALSDLQTPLTGGVLAKGEKVWVFLWETAPPFSIGIPHGRLRFSRFVNTESGCII